MKYLLCLAKIFQEWFFGMTFGKMQEKLLNWGVVMNVGREVVEVAGELLERFWAHKLANSFFVDKPTMKYWGKYKKVLENGKRFDFGNDRIKNFMTWWYSNGDQWQLCRLGSGCRVLRFGLSRLCRLRGANMEEKRLFFADQSKLCMRKWSSFSPRVSGSAHFLRFALTVAGLLAVALEELVAQRTCEFHLKSFEETKFCKKFIFFSCSCSKNPC